MNFTLKTIKNIFCACVFSLITSCFPNLNPSPVVTVVPNTPTLSIPTSTKEVVSKRPEDKFLFVQVWLSIEGVGNVPSALIDRPSYRFDEETKELSFNRNNEKLLLTISDFGFIGQGTSLEGTAGGGVGSILIPIKNIPVNLEIYVPTGNISQHGYSAEYKKLQANITEIYPDGSIYIEIDNELVILKPDEVWLVEKIITYSSDQYAGYKNIKSSIKNYGWLDIELINP
jgi:hypothetical protein